MLGTVIGDIVGSIYEFHNIKTKRFRLFGERCEFTDDSIMALAVAKALLDVGDNRDEAVLQQAFIRSMQELGRKYPHPMGAYGNRFSQWLRSDNPTPYNSWGNGSAMRVAACGFAGKSLEDAEYLARISAEVTHNHPQGVKGAQAVAACIYLARTDNSPTAIQGYVESRYYPLTKTLDEIRPRYRFDDSCQGTVPQAIQAFLEAADFEDAIRNAVSIGGDSDTLTAITGGIAEAFFGIPEDIRKKAREYLTPDLLEILDDFETMVEKN